MAIVWAIAPEKPHSPIIELAGYPAWLGFPIMHPFHALCAHFIIAITSLPLSQSLPSLLKLHPPVGWGVKMYPFSRQFMKIPGLLKFWPLNPQPQDGVGLIFFDFLDSSWHFPDFRIFGIEMFCYWSGRWSTLFTTTTSRTLDENWRRWDLG